jgi:ABC-type phosphate transport system permease subunit
VVITLLDGGKERAEIVTVDAMDPAIDIVGIAEVMEGHEQTWALFAEHHDAVRSRWDVRRDLEKHDTGEVNRQEEEARLVMREAELDLADVEDDLDHGPEDVAAARTVLATATQHYEEVRAWANAEFDRIRREINEINKENGRYRILLTTAGEGAKPPKRLVMKLEDIVRAYRANRLTGGTKFGIYLSRWKEYLTDEPREANMEGGVFPAIFGTVLMTLLMALAVVPFGVLASLYLREYAKAGPIVSTIRIAVNNLAGVPSIVYGVFGLGFFCYGVGGFIDGGPTWAMPKASWFLLLGGLCLTAIVAFTSLMFSLTRPGEPATVRKLVFRYASTTLWILGSLGLVVLIATTPFYDGFYRARLPNPTFGKAAMIWGSLTLAIMTLPVVIVATEEALSAVPNSMREGSYACGAGKWQTIRRIVMPRAMPGIMTGTILAMARGAGEVAPLMLVGAVKLAPELPFDWEFPFGVNRSFMHLGFHIYDVGFQSPNAEASKPMVYTTTLLLILIIAVLNITAIWLRSRLRKRFVGEQF